MLISLKMKENICIYTFLLAMTANNGISSLGCSCKVFFFYYFFSISIIFMTTDNSLQLATCKNYVAFPSCSYERAWCSL